MSQRHHSTVHYRRGCRGSTDEDDSPHAEGWAVGDGGVGGGNHRHDGLLHVWVDGWAVVACFGTHRPQADVAAEDRLSFPPFL